jgi:hypothetical protein
MLAARRSKGGDNLEDKGITSRKKFKETKWPCICLYLIVVTIIKYKGITSLKRLKKPNVLAFVIFKGCDNP